MHEKRAREFRYKNRKSVDEILRVLLNGDLFDMFESVKPREFPVASLKYRNHSEYLDKWEFLWTYELKSTLCNSRRGNSKEETGG
jgi:hypothetical protein